MTGSDIQTIALVYAQSEASRALEAGQTLGSLTLQYLNFVIDDLIREEYWDWIVQNSQPPLTPILTIPTVAEYDLPTGMIRATQIHFDTGSIDTRTLHGLPVHVFKEKWAAYYYMAADKAVDWCQISDTRFQIAPMPDRVYTMFVLGAFRSQITDLGVEVTAVPARYHEILTYGLAKRYAIAIRDAALLTQYDGLWAQKLAQMKAEFRKRPDIHFQLQPYIGSPPVYATNYWANPFIKEIG